MIGRKGRWCGVVSEREKIRKILFLERVVERERKRCRICEWCREVEEMGRRLPIANGLDLGEGEVRK